ncbi:hypothetical protein K2173_017105 [Erythroxylum novogranatense]|uniref:Uncharacterized protein n=1 Tax=Erythroxylum novogranatense TaxID=1862640 RepID=A0AAV8U9A0_9ROSI|nr:hypothetical protein K2173_017105 [Erythroxylum novogranatense]
MIAKLELVYAISSYSSCFVVVITQRASIFISVSCQLRGFLFYRSGLRDAERIWIMLIETTAASKCSMANSAVAEQQFKLQSKIIGAAFILEILSKLE